MKWIATVELRSGVTFTTTVQATNKADAEYRAAMRAEEAHGASNRVVACRPY